MYRIRTVFGGFAGTPWVNTLYFNDAMGTAQQAATAASTFWGAVDANMDTQVSWLQENDVAGIDFATGNLVTVFSITGGTGSGGGATDSLPIVSQGLVRWRTASVVNNREVRGRTFIPALVVGANTNGTVTPAVRTSIEAAATAMIGDANSELVVWHRPTTVGGSNGSQAAVIAASMWTNFAELRSRRD